MTVLILCAGTQQRFKSDTPKQLMPFHNKPLLQRTIAQVHNLGFKPHIITHNQDITNFCFCYKQDVYLFNPIQHNKIVETLLSTRELWSSRIIVLLGDVYYNNVCLQTTFNCNKPLCIVGNQVEIFSLSFNPSVKIINALQIAAQHHKGKLWHFYRVYAGMSIDEHKQGTLNILSIPSDSTSDIDTMKDYIILKTRIEN